MKGFHKCLFNSGHIKEDKGVPGRIIQPKTGKKKEKKNICGSREELKWVEASVNEREEGRKQIGDCHPP